MAHKYKLNIENMDHFYWKVYEIILTFSDKFRQLMLHLLASKASTFRNIMENNEHSCAHHIHSDLLSKKKTDI